MLPTVQSCYRKGLESNRKEKKTVGFSGLTVQPGERIFIDPIGIGVAFQNFRQLKKKSVVVLVGTVSRHFVAEVPKRKKQTLNTLTANKWLLYI